MLVDCQTCPVRGVHCSDCMVTALSALPIVTAPRPAPVRAGTDAAPRAHPGPGPGPVDQPVRTAALDRAERRAVAAMLGAGLVSTATANGARAVLEPYSEASARHAG